MASFSPGKKTLGSLMVAAAAAALVSFVGSNEGLRTKTYKDIVGINTVCYGETSPDIAFPGAEYTPEQCARMLEERLVEFAEGVKACTPIVFESPETIISAVDLAYNIGVPRYCSSTAAKHFKAGRLEEGCEAATRFKFAGGKVLPGLVVRREKGFNLCMQGVEEIRAREGKQ